MPGFKTIPVQLLRLFLLLAWLLVAPRPAAAQSPPAEFRPLEIGFHLGQGDAGHMQAARAAGGTFVVVVFSWADIEPEPGYLYWELPDAALRAAEFYGLEVIARLDQPPAWALDDNDPTPWDLQAYAAFARRAAERYGHRLAGLILWNEPNLSLEWQNRPPDAAAYAAMLRAAYPEVKAAAPDLPVLLGGLASTEGEGDWAINDLDYLQALYAAGAAPYFDVLTAHPYGFGRPPGDPPAKYRPNFRRLEMYREIMAAFGDDHKPVWVTEMGWLTWTDQPSHEWQVVSPQVQADYILGAIDYARQFYPWLERLGLWQLNAAGDSYGFSIWQGPGRTSPAYETLVATCAGRSPACDPAGLAFAPGLSSTGAEVPVLAPDVIIRLGDRDTLYPHWVHLYRSGGPASLAWQGEFFVGTAQAGRPFELLLETMGVGQASDRLWLNGVELAALLPRPGPNPASAWVTQRFSLPPGRLQAGLNRLALTVGPRNPARQYSRGRWENMQFRHIRLVPPAAPAPALDLAWQPQPAPSGWSETNRLRPGLAGDVWLTGARPGEVWQARPAGTGTPLLLNQAVNRPDLLFNDLLPLPEGELAATGRGLFWRPAAARPVRPETPQQAGDTVRLWQPVAGPPQTFAYVVARANGRFYAGFEGEGVWQAAAPTGPWQPAGLAAASVVDLLAVSPAGAAGERLYAVTGAAELYLNEDNGPGWQPLDMPGLSAEALAEAGESPEDKFWPHLFATTDGRLLVRRHDRLWQPDGQDPTGWAMVGPEDLAGKILAVLGCCDPGTLLGTNRAGLWRLDADGRWQRLDGDTFQATDITSLLRVQEQLFAAGELGLFHSAGGRAWQKADGLPPLVNDLVIDPAEPSRWLAATPAGVYRSQNSGQTWLPISPPWTVWDLAFGPQGRLFLGRGNGLAWTDTAGATPVSWQAAEGLERVAFLKVKPHPLQAGAVWSGTWGNNIGVSQDGGQNVAPLHNGLETLTGLDLAWPATPGRVILATLAGLYRSDDNGQSWYSLPGPLAGQTVHVLLQAGPEVLWAGAAGGLWLSRDEGTSWTRADTLPPVTVISLDRLAAPLSSSNGPAGGWLWAGTERDGLWLSADGGETWYQAGLPGRTVTAVTIDPRRPDRLVAATDRGIFAAAITARTLATLP